MDGDECPHSEGTLAQGLSLIAAAPSDFSHPAPAGLCTLTGTARATRLLAELNDWSRDTLKAGSMPFTES